MRQAAKKRAEFGDSDRTFEKYPRKKPGRKKRKKVGSAGTTVGEFTKGGGGGGRLKSRRKRGVKLVQRGVVWSEGKAPCNQKKNYRGGTDRRGLAAISEE